MASEKESRTRRDGRNANQIRPLAVEQGILNRADGSARFVQGNTSVLAAAYGPAPAKSSWMQKADGATVEVNFKPESGLSSPSDAEREMLLRRSLEEVILRSRYPRCVVSVVVQVSVWSVSEYVGTYHFDVHTLLLLSASWSPVCNFTVLLNLFGC